jgi:prevent-host-death family protein
MVYKKIMKKPFTTRVAEPRATYHRSGPVQVSQDIMPAAELKATLGDVLRRLDERRPIIVTLNGKAAAVLMSPAEFDRLTYEQRFIAAVNEGLKDVEEGRVVDGEEVFDELLAELDQEIAARKNDASTKSESRKRRKR